MKLTGMPRRLSNKLLLGLGAGMFLSSLIFLAVFVESYRFRLQEDRASASEQVNKLFQFSLENAMLKRDLPGLREIIGRLGQQPGILSVQIVNPALEVRFASSDGLLGGHVTLPDLGCTDCSGGVPALSPTSWLIPALQTARRCCAASTRSATSPSASNATARRRSRRSTAS